MSDLITRTARLVPYAKRPKQLPSFVTAYSYEPLPDEPAAHLGNLFVVIEVLVSGRSSEEVADLIIESIGNHYYNAKGADDTEPLARFESAVKSTNKELAEYVNQGNAAWIGKLSAVIAVQAGQDLHLTHAGSAEALLYRGKSAARISNQVSNRPTGPSKTFGSIASGGLEAGDRLLLATPALVHQVALTKLRSVVAATSPNSAIAEMTELLRGSASERIAALVIEVTTPELAALQVRSESPSEIQLGAPDNVVEAAKMAAAPLAQATMTSSKQVGAVAKRGWEQSQPHLRRAGLGAVSLLRRGLTGPGAKRRSLIVLTLGMVVVAGLWFWQSSSTRTHQLFSRYEADYSQFQLAEQARADGDKTGAKDLLGRLQAELKSLSQAPGRSALDTKLAKTTGNTSQPASVAAFAALVDTKLDELEGLVRVAPTTVVAFDTVKNSEPNHIEVAAGKAYLFDSHNNSALYIVNLTTNTLKTSAANTSKLGTIKGTTISSAGDGLYVITDKPSVWFYRFDTDTLTEQTLGLSQWPVAKSIASYAGNLYLLGDATVYKHLRTFSGFSPKSEYLTSAQATGIKGATSLAIDGSVYVLSPSGLHQYLAGALKQTAEVPSSLTSAGNLRVSTTGDHLVATSGSTKRLGLWNASGSKLVFDKQIELAGTSTLYDAIYDTKSATLYVLVDGRLVKAQL